MAWEDLPASMGVSGLGTLELESTRGTSPVNVVRIYNDSGPNGTNGMTVDALRQSDALAAGSTGILIAPPDPVRARFNIGIVTLEARAEIGITVRDRAGNVVRTTDLSFPPRVLIQTGANSLLGVELGGSDTIHLKVASGNAIVYGSTTDNTTNDPSLQVAGRTPHSRKNY